MPLLDVEKFRYWLKKKNEGMWDLVVLFEENGFKKKNPERYKEISEENLNYYCELFGVTKDALLFKPDEIKKPIQQSLFCGGKNHDLPCLQQNFRAARRQSKILQSRL